MVAIVGGMVPRMTTWRRTGNFLSNFNAVAVARTNIQNVLVRSCSLCRRTRYCERSSTEGLRTQLGDSQ